MSDPAEVLQAALELEARDHAELVDAIAASLDGFDLSAEWEGEIQRRIDDIDSGRVKPLSGDEVLDRREQRLRGR